MQAASPRGRKLARVGSGRADSEAGSGMGGPDDPVMHRSSRSPWRIGSAHGYLNEKVIFPVYRDPLDMRPGIQCELRQSQRKGLPMQRHPAKRRARRASTHPSAGQQGRLMCLTLDDVQSPDVRPGFGGRGQ